MHPILETERLALRELVPEDADSLAGILCDEKSMRYYPAPASAMPSILLGSKPSTPTPASTTPPPSASRKRTASTSSNTSKKS